MIKRFKFFKGINNGKPLQGQSAYEYYGRQENNVSNIQIWTEAYHTAQRGYPINNYPLYLNERQRETFYRAWNHFTNNQ